MLLETILNNYIIAALSDTHFHDFVDGLTGTHVQSASNLIASAKRQDFITSHLLAGQWKS